MFSRSITAVATRIHASFAARPSAASDNREMRDALRACGQEIFEPFADRDRMLGYRRHV